MKGRGKGRHSPAAPGRRAAQNIRKSNDAGPNNKNKNVPVSKHKVFVGTYLIVCCNTRLMITCRKHWGLD